MSPPPVLSKQVNRQNSRLILAQDIDHKVRHNSYISHEPRVSHLDKNLTTVNVFRWNCSSYRSSQPAEKMNICVA